MGWFIRKFDGKRETTYLSKDATWGQLDLAMSVESPEEARIIANAYAETDQDGWRFDIQLFDERPRQASFFA